MAPSRPPRPPSRPARDPKELLKKRGADLIRKVSDKDRYGIFLEPVDVEQVEGYVDLINRPMDLSTAQKNLQMGVYRTPMELRADLDLIWSNCCTFNADDSIYFKEAVRLRALAARYYDDLVRLLAKDGVAAALGLSSSRQNGPSSARMSQKRPPRHRASSQNSDFPLRMTSPSLQTSEPNSVDLDGDSQSASASASAGNLTSFRDAHLRRARSNFDAAVLASSTISAEARQAADAAGLHAPEPASSDQIFNGPDRIIGRQPEPQSVTLSPRKYPIMSGTGIRDSCTEVPGAWRRIGRWHTRGATVSRFLTRNRAVDVQVGRRFQKYVEKSAPMARRLLAAILDPNTIYQNDLQESSLEEKSPDASAKESALSNPVPETVKTVASTKGNSTDLQKNGIKNPMEVDTIVASATQGTREEDFQRRKRPRGKEGNIPLYRTSEEKRRGAFKDVLESAVGAERFSRFPSSRIEELADSTQNLVPKNSIYRLRALLKTKGIDSAFVNHILAHDQDNETGLQKQRDQPSLDADVQTHRRILAHLLYSNHAIMLNILRIRALRENADEAAVENLEDREREYVERLADGMSLAVRSLPPRFVVHPLDAAESAFAMARTINSRQSTPNH